MVSAGEGWRSGFGGSAPACLPAADAPGDLEEDGFGPDGGVEAGGVGVAELGGEPVRPRRYVGVGGVLVAEVVGERVAVEVEAPVAGCGSVVASGGARLVGEQRPAVDGDADGEGVGDQVA